MSTLSDKFVVTGIPGDPVVGGLMGFIGSGTTSLHRAGTSDVVDNKKCTIAGWVKRPEQSLGQGEGQGQDPFFTFGTTGGSNDILLYLHHWNASTSGTNEDTIHFRVKTSGTSHTSVLSWSKIRDGSQWHHIAAVYDSTQSTASDRAKIYINGQRQAGVTTTYPSQNQVLPTYSAENFYVGRLGTSQSSGAWHEMAISDVYFIDGHAVEPMNNFIKISSVTPGAPLIPLEYDGDMEGNSFHLKMGGSSGVYADVYLRPETPHAKILHDTSSTSARYMISNAGSKSNYGSHKFRTDEWGSNSTGDPGFKNGYGPVWIGPDVGTPFTSTKRAIQFTGPENTGTGQGFTTPTDSDMEFGTGDFAISYWSYQKAHDVQSWQTVCSYGYNAEGSILIQGLAGDSSPDSTHRKTRMSLRMGSESPAERFLKERDDVATEQWNHYVWGRKSGVGYLIRNGSLQETRDIGGAEGNTFDVGISSGTLSVGYADDHPSGSNYTRSYNGFIEDFRWLKGSYPSEWVPFKDISASAHDVVPKQIGGTTDTALSVGCVDNVTSSEKKLGYASIKFDPGSTVSSGSYTQAGHLEIANHSDFALGSNDFTMEFWINPAHLSYPTSGGGAGGAAILNQSINGAASDSSFICWLTNSGTLSWFTSNTAQTAWLSAIASVTVSAGSWQHVAFVRSGDTLTPYLNGTAGTSGSFTSNFSVPTSSSRPVTVGMQQGALPVHYDGRLQDIRIVNGTAITPPAGGPSEPLTAVTNTKLLIQSTGPLATPTARSADVSGTQLLIQQLSTDSTLTDKSSEARTLTVSSHLTPATFSNWRDGERSGWTASTPYEDVENRHSLAIHGPTTGGGNNANSTSNSIADFTTDGSSTPSNWGPTTFGGLDGDKFTMEGWFYCNKYNVDDSPGTMLMTHGQMPRTDHNTNYVGWGLYVDSNLKLRFGFSEDGTLVSSTAYDNLSPAHASETADLYTWHHFAVCGDGTNIRVYLNGKGVSMTHDNLFSTTSSGLRFGGGAASADWQADRKYGAGHLYFSDVIFVRDNAHHTTTDIDVPLTIRPLTEIKDGGIDSADNGGFTTSGTFKRTIDTPNHGQNYNNMVVFDGWSSNKMTFAGLNIQKATSGLIKTIPAAWGASPISSTKYYWEVFCENVDSDQQAVGVVDVGKVAWTEQLGQSAYSWGVLTQSNSSYGDTRHNNSFPDSDIFGGSATNGDIIQCAMDAKNGKLWFGKNNTWVGDPAAGTGASFTNLDSADLLHPAITNWGSSGDGEFIVNFGQTPDFIGHWGGRDTSQSEFYYAPPSGFVSMKSDNSDPEIDDPEKNFEIKTWNGGQDPDMGVGGDTTISGMQFQPGIIWTRFRFDSYKTNSSNNYEGNYVFDSVQEFGTGGINIDGENINSYSQLNSFETGVDSVNSNGFVVSGEETNYGYSDDGETITDPEKYVGFCWKLGKVGSSWSGTGADPDTEHYSDETGVSVIAHDNESGTIGSTLTLNHSLGRKPKFAIAWDRNQEFLVPGHYVWHHDLDDNKYLKLDGTAAQSTWTQGDGSDAGDLPPFPANPATSTTFKIGDAINMNNLHIYLFAEINGFSKFGFIDGRGADPNYVAMGFKPRFFMFRRIDSGPMDWYIYDTARDNHAAVGHLSRWVKASENDEETAPNTAAHYLDFVGNGVTLRNASSFSNTASGSYIYAAFAEKPWKTSRGTYGA